MEETMVDRIATALANSKTSCRYLGFDELDAIARVALEAMREPTTDMMFDGLVKPFPRAMLTHEALADTWRAMIDAALPTPPNTTT